MKGPKSTNKPIFFFYLKSHFSELKINIGIYMKMNNIIMTPQNLDLNKIVYK